MIRLAGIQMTSGPSLEDNLRAAEGFLHEAARENAQVAVLPENFALFAGDYRRCAELNGERIQQWLARQARELGLFLVGGTIPLLTREDGSTVAAPRVRSVSLVYGPDGNLLARYDKLHLFDAQVEDAHGRYRESAVFEPGEQVRVVDIAGICTGLAVCYDLRFASQARALADKGASLLLYPSAFTEATGEAHWKLLLQARAVETGCYVFGVNQCGQHTDTRRSYGHTLLVDPWGDVVAERASSPGVLIADLCMQRLEEVRRRMPVHDHQKFTVQLNDD